MRAPLQRMRRPRCSIRLIRKWLRFSGVRIESWWGNVRGLSKPLSRFRRRSYQFVVNTARGAWWSGRWWRRSPDREKNRFPEPHKTLSNHLTSTHHRNLCDSRAHPIQHKPLDRPAFTSLPTPSCAPAPESGPVMRILTIPTPGAMPANNPRHHQEWVYGPAHR